MLDSLRLLGEKETQVCLSISFISIPHFITLESGMPAFSALISSNCLRKRLRCMQHIVIPTNIASECIKAAFWNLPWHRWQVATEFLLEFNLKTVPPILINLFHSCITQGWGDQILNQTYVHKNRSSTCLGSLLPVCLCTHAMLQQRQCFSCSSQSMMAYFCSP